MGKNYSIEVKNVEKCFRVYLDKGSSLKEKALFWERNKYVTRTVLRGISFNVEKGEAIGLIGHNGCGKSTTLKLLNRIIYPDKGEIIMRGRVSSLIELGAGFHPDMSGRENIYTNASIFGLTKKEINARIDEIIEFSELEEFIDNPVRTYSSGMYMRLAFSVAINVDADILLIDEILAVGDLNFQKKCFNKLREIKAKGTTIVIVSHDLGQIEKICNRTIWLQDGLIQEEGIPLIVNRNYKKYMEELSEGKEKEYIKHINKEKRISKYRGEGNFAVEFTDISLVDEKQGEEKQIYYTGDDILLKAKYQRNDDTIKNAEVAVLIIREDGIMSAGTTTQLEEIENVTLNDFGTISIKMKDVHLVEGKYYINLKLRDYATIIYHDVYEVCKFEIKRNRKSLGVTAMDFEFKYDDIVPTKEKFQEGLDVTKINIKINTDQDFFEVREGEDLYVDVNVHNLSEETIGFNRFYPISLCYHLYSSEGNMIFHEGKRTLIKEDIAFNEAKTLTMIVETKYLNPGKFKAELTLVQDKVAWFNGINNSMQKEIMVKVVGSDEKK